MVSQATKKVDTSHYRKMGKDNRRNRQRLGRKTDEDKMGHLQHSRSTKLDQS